jgi:uroporphyrinogen decarboxylase
MTMPALLMGIEKWVQLLMLGPHELRDVLLAKCSDFFQKQVAAYRAAGADVLVYSNPFGSTDFIPRKFFNELSLPWMERDLKPGGTAGIVYYCGSARFNDVIEAVIKRLGIGVYYLSPLDDLAEGKKLVAGRGLTCGVINDIMLLEWSGEQIKKEVKRMIDIGKPGGKFLFGTLVMPYNIPEENIRTMLAAAYEYGRIDQP